MIRLKKLSYLFSFVLFLALLSLSVPKNTFADVGCCDNVNNDQCTPGLSFPTKIDANQTDCENATPPPKTWIAGEECVGSPPMCQPVTVGCCKRSEVDDCVYPSTETACTDSGYDYLGDGPCLPQFAEQCTPPPPTGCCTVTGMPNVCTNNVPQNECEGTFIPDATCTSSTSCTAPPPIEGCCQTDTNTCNSDNNQQCADAEGTFYPGGTCTSVGDNSYCEVPPGTGCCVLGNSVCEITTADDCTGQDGTYLGDGKVCPGAPTCGVQPTGCCVFGSGDCTVTTSNLCDGASGTYLGNNISCPDTCKRVSTSDVPTISQWGLIGVAGMLGLFSLLILIRRQRLT